MIFRVRLDRTQAAWRGLAIVLSLLAVAACSEPVQQQPTFPGLPGSDIGPGTKKDTALAEDTTETVDEDAVDAGIADAEDTAGEDVDDATVDTGPLDAYDGPICSKNSVCADYAKQSGKSTKWCAVSLNQCVECLFDLHCEPPQWPAGTKCLDFKCQTINCTPGKSHCEGEFLQVCNPDGKGFTAQACPDATPACVGDSCRVCEPDNTYCAKPEPGEQPKVLMQCNGDGSKANVKEICAAGTTCQAGKCQACIPGTKQCEGDKAMVCKDDGSGYQLAQDCAANGWTCQGGLCVDPCASDIKSKTNVGCDYWAVDLDNAYVPCSSATGFCDAQNAQFSVIVSNTQDKLATVTVKAGNGMEAKYTVQPNGLKILNLPDPAWKIKPLQQEGTGINKNVYRISSDRPIVAYQFNPLQNFDVFSNDASLLLPSNGIGTEYWVLSREQSHDSLKSYLTVIATQPGTTKVTVVASYKTVAGPGVTAMKPGETKQFELTQGQVLNLESNGNGEDPTGSYIKSDKAIAVFGGSEASNSPNTDHCVGGKCQVQGWACSSNNDCPKTCCADHLEEQLFPISSWGTSYVATKLQPRGKEKDAWRILAAENGTTVTTEPPQVQIPVLNQGEWFEFESSQDFVITADKPISVGQFMASSHAPDPNNDTCDGKFVGQKVCTYFWSVQQTPVSCQSNADCPNIPEPGDAKIGDPAFLLAVAADAFLNEYVFLVPDKYTENYVNIIVPAGTTATLDAQNLVPGAFKPVAGGWSVARLPVKPGAHTLKSAKNVGLLVYGYSDYVSYGYPGGVALK